MSKLKTKPKHLEFMIKKMEGIDAEYDVTDPRTNKTLGLFKDALEAHKLEAQLKDVIGMIEGGLPELLRSVEAARRLEHPALKDGQLLSLEVDLEKLQEQLGRWKKDNGYE